MDDQKEFDIQKVNPAKQKPAWVTPAGQRPETPPTGITNNADTERTSYNPPHPADPDGHTDF